MRCNLLEQKHLKLRNELAAWIPVRVETRISDCFPVGLRWRYFAGLAVNIYRMSSRCIGAAWGRKSWKHFRTGCDGLLLDAWEVRI